MVLPQTTFTLGAFMICVKTAQTLILEQIPFEWETLKDQISASKLW